MSNYEFVKSSYDVPQNGTFEMFTVKFNSKDLFYWSDNNGLVSFKTKECIEDVYTSVYPIYLAMEATDIATQKEWDRVNKGIEDNYITVYSREGRTDEFGVNWTEL